MNQDVSSVATVAVVDPSPRIAGVGWRSLSLLVVAGLAAIVFWIVAALPYLLLDEGHLARYDAVRVAILAHIAFGTVALLTGPLQLWLGLSDRRIDIHRKLGQVYMAAIVASAAAAYYLAVHTNGGWVFGAGLAGLATAWLLTTGLAYVAVRRYHIDQHKEWMIRSYVVTLGFVTFRLLVVLLQAAHVGSELEQIAAASWFCWAIPLLITEVALQGRKVFAS